MTSSCVLPSLFISIKIVNFALWCVSFLILFLVYYEARKRELNIRLMYECRFDERLKAPAEALADVYLQENKKGRKPRVCKMSRLQNFFFVP